MSPIVTPTSGDPGWTVVITFPNGQFARFDHHHDGWWSSPTPTSNEGLPRESECPERGSGPFTPGYIQGQVCEGRAVAWEGLWPLRSCEHSRFPLGVTAAEAGRNLKQGLAAITAATPKPPFCDYCGHRAGLHIDGYSNTRGCGDGYPKSCGCKVPAHLIGKPLPKVRRNPTWRGPNYELPAHGARHLTGLPVTVHKPTDLDLCVLYGNVPISPLGADEPTTYVTRGSIDWPKETAA